jgi:NADPH:quinone reductase
MKAIVLTAPGAPEALQYKSIADLAPPQGQELLVRLRAASVNPIDTKLRQRGGFFGDHSALILGCDGAGLVEAIGPEVQRFAVGDAVYFCNGGLGREPGTYAQYALVDERFVAPKPQSLSFEEAAAVPLVLITAWEALYDRARLQAIQTVLIHGGAGGVGHMAIQLAKLRGARVCTTISSEAKAEFVHRLGAELAIDYRCKNIVSKDVVTQVLDWTDGKGVHCAFDTVGGQVLEQTFPAVRVYGDVVSILAPDAATNWKIARDRNLRFSLTLMLTPQLQNLVEARKAQAQMLKDAAVWFDQGSLRVQVDRVLPLEDAAEAHRLLEAGGQVGKIVLAIW